ncbi:MAG: chorismate mutase [Patescibacteria group bacterium]|nr:chorismate mutase [Patescibacteria group bacterium]
MERLESIRQEIDKTDKAIVDLIAQRLELARKAGRLKKAVGVKIIDRKREEEVLAKRAEIGGELGLSTEFVKDLFKKLIEEARKAQGSGQ